MALEQASSHDEVKRVRRPVGVWIATIWAAFFAGLFPLGFTLFFFLGPAKGAGIMSGLELVFALALGIGVIVSAIGAWNGLSSARYALVALVAIHYALVAYQNLSIALAGVEVRGSEMLPWARVVRSIVTAAIIAGYLLLGRRARQFFDPASNAG